MILGPRRFMTAILLLTALLALAACGGPAATSQGDGVANAAARPEAAPADPAAVRIALDPAAVPAPVGDREPQHVVVELETVELNGVLAEGTTYTYWTFNGTVP